MAKSKSLSLYLIGMILVVVGCFLPLTASGWGFNGSNVIDYIKNGSGDSLVTAIMVLGGAAAGIVFSFVALKGIPAKLISLIISVAGGIYMILTILNLNPVAKKIGKAAWNLGKMHPSWGLALIVLGWVVAVVGYLQNKD